MKRIHLLLFLFITANLPSMAQSADIVILNKTYPEFREASLSQRRFKHANIQPLLDKLNGQKNFDVMAVGESVEGRTVSMVKFGSGPVKILLWSQMHGDESTATMALFDIFNFLLDSDVLGDRKQYLANRATVYFIPMLNPDGAERFQRRNVQGIDINRDAVRLQTNEGRILQAVHDQTEARFGFNLHDQSRYYNVEGTSKPATISVLAPAFNEDKDINPVRKQAMQLIVRMNKTLQKFAPGHVGRYSDDFEPRAFGDNIQLWGTSTILIESGGYYSDREKQQIRKLNYLAILDALFAIADNSFKNEDISGYEAIPRNDQKLFDLKISEVTIPGINETYIADLGVNLSEKDHEDHETFYFTGEVDDLGDLSTHFGYQSLDGSDMELVFPRIYEGNEQEMSRERQLELLKNGFGYIRTNTKPEKTEQYNLLNSAGPDFNVSMEVKPGFPATFFLKDQEKIRYAVINGFLIDLSEAVVDDSFNSIYIDE